MKTGGVFLQVDLQLCVCRGKNGNIACALIFSPAAKENFLLMNIIVLTTAGMASGGVRQALYLAHTLQNQGHNVHFVCRPIGEPKNLALEMGLKCTDLSHKQSFLEANKILRALMPKGEEVIVHAFHNRGIKIAGYLGTLWRLQGLPVSCAIHRGVTFVPRNPLPYLLPGIRRYMVNSLAAGRTLPLFGKRKRCVVVDNAIPEDRLQITRTVADLRKELNIPDGHLIVGNISQDKPKKGTEELVRAYALARPHLPPSTLLVAGINPAKTALLCKELGIEEHCRLIGRTEHVANYIQLMSLLVFPSHFIESQPNVILEAMGLGVPVIGSTIGGIPEILPSDCLFDPKDINEISRKIAEMLNSPERLRVLGEMNMAQKPVYSAENRMQVIMGHYRSMLAELGKNPPGRFTKKFFRAGEF